MGFLYSQLFVTPTFPTTSCSGRTVVVTGSNVGLGKEAARHFARLGASKIILAVRNTESGEAAKKDIEASTGCPSSVVEVWPLDLSSFDSIKSFAKKMAMLTRLDILVENAGIATEKYTLAEGHERTITVNVIGTFLLALLAMPKLEATATEYDTSPVLSIVSSEVHGWTKFPEHSEADIFAALKRESKKAMMERYPTSKLLEILVVRQIAPKLVNSKVTLNILNPGLCHSELARDSGMFLVVLKFFLARSTEVGSRTLVLSGLAGPESHGKYMSDGNLNEGLLSSFVTSKEGAEASSKVWSQLGKILESVQPGVTRGLL